MGDSKFISVVLAPFLHNRDKVLNLWIVRILQHLDDFNELFFGLLSSDNHLEHSDCCTSLSFPEFWIRVKSFKDIECFYGVVELSHLVAIVGNQVEKA